MQFKGKEICKSETLLQLVRLGQPMDKRNLVLLKTFELKNSPLLCCIFQFFKMFLPLTLTLLHLLTAKKQTYEQL